MMVICLSLRPEKVIPVPGTQRPKGMNTFIGTVFLMLSITELLPKESEFGQN